MFTHTRIRTDLLFLPALAMTMATHGATIYVDVANCPGPGDGSIGDPYCSIQAAIDNAVDTDEVIVSPGTYFEAIDFGGLAITVRSSGGAGVTTIDGNGALHVVQCVSGETSATVLDGFTITGGNANGAEPDDRGGGMLNNNSSHPTVINCTFSGNTAGVGGGAGGGGMANYQSSSPTVTNCTFSGNGGANVQGGGMYNRVSSNPTVTDCSFNNNNAINGGGMLNVNSSPTVTDCTFSGNTAVFAAGMSNMNSSSPIVTGCIFSGNMSGNIGGGGMSNSNSSPTVTTSAFSGNTGGNRGGGMFNENASSVTVTACSFSNNAALSGGGIYNQNGSSVDVSDSSFSNNTAGSGGAILNNDSSSIVTNCTFSENTANSGVFAAGGAIWHDGTLTVINCTFFGNMASGSFGEGGALYTRGSSTTLINGTFAGNTALSMGGAIRIAAVPGIVTVSNCVLWGNTAGGSGDEIVDNASSTTTIRFSDILGSGGSGGGWDASMGIDGGGNIDADPLFVNPGTGNYRLAAGSPAIDAGHNWAIAGIADTDLDGNPRFVAHPADFDPGCGIPAVVDMGAFEHQIGVPFPVKLGDIDGDGIVGIVDFLALLGEWGSCMEQCCLADLDLDGIVGINDFLILLGNWG